LVHGGVKVFFKTLSATTIIVLIALVVTVWRLSQGPVSVGFLVPYISEALSDIDDGIEFEAADAIVRWTGLRDQFAVQITDVKAEDSRGRIIAAFPEMTVSLSLRSILDGLPSPEQITIVKPVLRFTRTVDQRILLGFQPSQVPQNDTVTNTEVKESPATALAQAIVQGLTSSDEDLNRVGYLRRVRVSDATVVFADQGSGAQWFVPSGQIVLGRNDSGISVEGVLPFINQDKESDVRIAGAYDIDARELSMSLEFEDIRPASFAPLLPQFSFLSGATLDASGVVVSTLSVTPSAVLLEDVEIAIMRGRGEISIPAPVARTYQFSDINLTARLYDGLDRASIDLATLQLEGGATTLSGKLMGEGLSKDAPTVTANVEIDRVTLEQLKRFWPEAIKPNTGRWISNNLNNGEVTEARFDFEFSGPSLEDMNVQGFSGRGLVSGVDVTYLRSMPPVLATNGFMTLSSSEVIIDVTGGTVIQNSRDGVLTLEEGRVRLHGLDSKNQQADIDVRVNGTVQDAIALIDSEPLRYASALGIDPDSTSGFANVALAFDFSLIQDLRLSDVDVECQASLSQVAIEQAVLNLDLTSGQFRLDLDNSGMNITGTAALGGIRSGISWRENFLATDFKRRYAVDAVIENNQRPLVGLGASLFEPPYMDGAVRVEALYTIDNDNGEELVVEADLADAVLNFDEINWVKQSGDPALLTAEVSIPEGGAIDVQRFALNLPERENALIGRIRLNGNTILSLDVDTLVIGDNRMSVAARRQRDGELQITMSGEVLDGRSFWKSLQQSNKRRSLQQVTPDAVLRTPITLDASIGTILLSQSGEMNNASVRVVQDVQGLQSIAFDGDLNDGTPFTFSLEPDGDERRFSASSENGGRVFRELGFGDDFVSGKFAIDGLVDQGGAVSGAMKITNFRLVDAPFLARLLSVAALTGIVDELAGGGISFSELNLPFTYSDNVLSINEGTMYGPSIGLTAKGDYDLLSGTVNGEGTVIPAYAVNSAFGAIPLLGPVLTGGEEGGGVFAATYVVRGSEGANEITVNPLATITPGFLRQIFKVFEPAPVEAAPTSVDSAQSAESLPE